MSELSSRVTADAGAPDGGRHCGRSEMAVASRTARARHRIKFAEFRLEDELDNSSITWGTTLMDASQIPRPHLQVWTRAHRAELTTIVLEYYDEMH